MPNLLTAIKNIFVNIWKFLINSIIKIATWIKNISIMLFEKFINYEHKIILSAIMGLVFIILFGTFFYIKTQKVKKKLWEFKI